MAGREKPKRKALHRGLDDIINRDASLTSRLLGRVKAPSREPLETPTVAEELEPEAEPEQNAPEPLAANEAVISTLLTKHSVVPSTDEARRPARAGKRGMSEHLKAVARHKPASTRLGRKQDIAAGRGSASNAVRARRGAVPSFEAFAERWGFLLCSGIRLGKLRICEVLYNNTYAIGLESFFTSYEKLAKLANLERKQCSINVRQLESLGFVERLHIYNTATRQGTEFKLHLEQLSTEQRRIPRSHYYDYDEDLK